MEAERSRKPGSVRLTDAQYAEMERLGIESESAYVKYKLNGDSSEGTPHGYSRQGDAQHGNAQHGSARHGNAYTPQHLQVLRQEVPELPESSEPMTANSSVADQLTIQRLSLENQQLQQKLDELSQNQDETLSGIHSQVEGMLRDELLKRDLEALKKENSGLQRELEKAEKELAKSEQVVEEKVAEIEELVKKLGLVELGKVLLPGAIHGLAKRYPQQMQGLASTLGSLSGDDVQQLLPRAELNEEQQNLLNIAQYVRELFDDEQFGQVIQLIAQLGEQVKLDSTMINKVSYYLNQMAKIRTAKERKEANTDSSPEMEQTANG